MSHFDCRLSFVNQVVHRSHSSNVTLKPTVGHPEHSIDRNDCQTELLSAYLCLRTLLNLNLRGPCVEDVITEIARCFLLEVRKLRQ